MKYYCNEKCVECGFAQSNGHCSVTACMIPTETMKDGIYMEMFAIKNGIRYNAKVINMKDVSVTLTNSLMDGIGKLCELEVAE